MKSWALGCFLVLAALAMGAVGAGWQQPASAYPATESEIRLSPAETELYKRARTLIGWTDSEIHDCPFFHKLQLAATQEQLPAILDRVGQTTLTLLQDFPQVSCDEAVDSESYQGWAHTQQHRMFRYIVIPHPDDPVPTFEEYRTEPKGDPLIRANIRGLPLITYNFVSCSLYVSPADQRDNHFRYFGTQKMRKSQCHVLGFAQDAERVRRAGNFHLRGKNGVLLLQGLVWIDSQTFQILQIRTWLLAPRADIGLNQQTSTIDFYPLQPADSQRVLWLPRDVIVTVFCSGFQARNTHHYSNLKLFRVESAIKP